ncbi:hypothetical protein FHS83_000151 [Rhizomicrobium palustre]|uniref:Transposase n=1 Tax=Rhizomicrobium palustre TaxID=189966 RepID=A0A846MU03_9PROT|nr:hypothetical protein [Rhizomicrobium palustre]
MDVSDAKKLKALEEENRKLKTLLAETMLDVAMLKDLNSKNVWPARPCKGRGSANGDSLHKCIRPLASGPLLRPGHDEIRTHRSQIHGSGKHPLF